MGNAKHPSARLLGERWRDLDTHGDSLRVSELPSFHLSRLAAFLRRQITQRVLVALELNYGEWRVLAALGELGAINTPRLVRMSSMDKAQISRAVERLAKKGLVAKEQDPSDERRQILELTSAGIELNTQAIQQIRAMQLRLLSTLNDTEREMFAHALVRMERALQDLDAEPPQSKP